MDDIFVYRQGRDRNENSSGSQWAILNYDKQLASEDHSSDKSNSLTGITGLCVQSDTMSMIQKVQIDLLLRQCMELVQSLTICSITFILVSGHAGV